MHNAITAQSTSLPSKALLKKWVDFIRKVSTCNARACTAQSTVDLPTELKINGLDIKAQQAAYHNLLNSCRKVLSKKNLAGRISIKLIDVDHVAGYHPALQVQLHDVRA